MNISKRGQQNVVAIVIGAFVALYVIALIAIAGFNDWNFGIAVSQISDFTNQVVGPLFSAALGLNGGNNDFLMILTFILLVIVITGTLDSASMFTTGGSSGRWINLFIGVIVSIIGVRFMPADIWGSLTSPSSALVATILLGIPFGAFFFMSMKLKSTLARKLAWLFYVIFLTYLVIKQSTGGFIAVYFIFLVLSAVMLFFDGTVRALFYKEQAAVQMADMIGNMNVKQRYKLRKEIEDYNNVIADPNAPAADIDKAKKKITALEKQYGDLSTI